MRTFLLSLAALCCASFQAPPAPNAAAPTFEAAQALKQKADYAGAAAAFDAFALANAGTPRGVEALVEKGVCLFSLGRAQQKNLRNTERSTATLTSALAVFQGVVEAHGSDPSAGRAQYMKGSAQLFLGDIAAAESEYGKGFERFRADVKYAPKSLERRAAMRRHLLRSSESTADLRMYLQLFPASDAGDKASVERYLELATLSGAKAPALHATSWIQGDPTTLDALHGDVVVLYFFATWCENCEKARPFVLDLFARTEPHGVRWIGLVDKTQGQTPESVRAFLATKELRFPVVQDDGTNAKRERATKIPHMVVIDRGGRVRWSDNPQNLQDATIDLLLAEDPSAPVK